MALAGIPRPMHAEPVALPRADVFEVPVPAERGPLRQSHTGLDAVVPEEAWLRVFCDLAAASSKVKPACN